MGRIPPDGEKSDSPAHWSKAARERSREMLLRAVGKNRRMRQRLEEAEDLIERAGEDYRRSLLSGAGLPPPSAMEATAATIRMGDPDEPTPF